MPVINYIEFDGAEYSVEVAEGISLMQGAKDNLIEGIVAECGTCHCIIEPQWAEVAGSAGNEEAELLALLDITEPTSRLSCQVKVTAAMEGMRVRLPESQY